MFGKVSLKKKEFSDLRAQYQSREIKKEHALAQQVDGVHTFTPAYNEIQS